MYVEDVISMMPNVQKIRFDIPEHPDNRIFSVSQPIPFEYVGLFVDTIVPDWENRTVVIKTR